MFTHSINIVELVLYILTGYQVPSIVCLYQLMGARHTHNILSRYIRPFIVYLLFTSHGTIAYIIILLLMNNCFIEPLLYKFYFVNLIITKEKYFTSLVVMDKIYDSQQQPTLYTLSKNCLQLFIVICMLMCALK